MADKDRHVDELGHPDAGHEERDVDTVVITKFGIGLALIMIATLFLVWGLFNFFIEGDGGPYTAAPPLSAPGTAGARVPPQPRLQDKPRTDLGQIRGFEDKALHSYGWVDPAKTTVHIPIERAMEIVAQRGLPARAQAPPPVGSQNNLTQSGGGAILQQPGGPLAPQLDATTAPPPQSEGTKK
jgi:hypothetical protein